MMVFSEKWGKDIETAKKLALQELKVSEDDVKVTVLEEPSKGFLGIGSKLALVRVEVIEKNESEISKMTEYKMEESNDDGKVNSKIGSENVVESKTDGNELNNSSTVEITGDGVEDEDVKLVLEFLQETTAKMGISLDFKVNVKDLEINVDISGKDAGTIIGKRGQTLDAIQYLTSLVVNKNKSEYIRVVLDAENYRLKREKTLEKLAHKLADKVVRTGRNIKLEPMNPYERMIIHSALQGNDKVLTRSEGEDPYRRIVIELK